MTQPMSYVTGEHATGLRVAVAEDDDDQRAALEAALEVEGFQVLSFEDGFELLDYFEARHRAWPDAIVSDVNMPGRSGLDALAVARARGVVAPIFVITGDALPEVRVRVDALGNALLIEKPIDVERLARAIRELAAVHDEVAPEHD